MIRLSRFMIRPYTPQLLLVLILVFGQSLAALYLPTLLADIVDNGIVKSDTGYICATGGLMLLITLGGAVAPSSPRSFRRGSRSASARIICAQALHARGEVLAARVRHRRHGLADHAHDQ